MNVICDVNDYIFNPINKSRKIKFQKLFGNFNGKNVLDLGSGYAGIYWALGYIDNVETVNFYDFFGRNIHTIESLIDQMSPEFLQENFGDTISFLQSKGILRKNITYKDLAQQYIEKIADISAYTFNDTIEKETYDCILSIEAIEYACSECEFEKVIQNVYNALPSGGRFIGNIVHYMEQNSTIEKLIACKKESKLDLDEKLLKKFLKEGQFKYIETDEICIPRGKHIYFFCEK